jgi:hypothetical protein
MATRYTTTRQINPLQTRRAPRVPVLVETTRRVQRLQVHKFAWRFVLIGISMNTSTTWVDVRKLLNEIPFEST